MGIPAQLTKELLAGIMEVILYSLWTASRAHFYASTLFFYSSLTKLAVLATAFLTVANGCLGQIPPHQRPSQEESLRSFLRHYLKDPGI